MTNTDASPEFQRLAQKMALHSYLKYGYVLPEIRALLREVTLDEHANEQVKIKARVKL